MRSSAEPTKICDFLEAVYPVYAAALPPVKAPESGQSSTSGADATTLLRAEFVALRLLLRTRVIDASLSEKQQHELLLAQQAVLVQLESLVQGNIFKDVAVEDQNGYLPKLRQLRLRVPDRETKTPQDEEVIHSLAALVAFGPPEQYGPIIIVTRHLNNTLSRLQAYDSPRIDINTVFDCEDRLDMTPVFKARKTRENSERLYKLLKEALCSGTMSSHEASICLSGFIEQDFEMLFAVCSAKARWQQVQFSSRDQQRAHAIVNNICAEVQKSQTLQRKLSLCYDENCMRKPSLAYCKGKKGPVCPQESLRDLLMDHGKEVDPEAKDARKAPPSMHLTYKQKRGLAVALARSLLHLHGSPFLQHTWTADHIRLDRRGMADRDSSSLVEAFITFDLGGIRADVDEQKADKDISNPHIFALAVLLMELETGVQVQPNEDDRDEDTDEPSLFAALGRMLDELEGQMDEGYRSLIGSCLDLCLHEDSDSVAFREDLFRKVVYPLEKHFEWSFPEDFKKIFGAKTSITDSAIGKVRLLDSEDCMPTAKKVRKQVAFCTSHPGVT